MRFSYEPRPRLESSVVEVSASSGTGLTLRPIGQLCHFRMDPLRASFQGALACEPTSVRIDVAEVSLLSSWAVTFLEEAAAACTAQDVHFAVVGADGLNRRVLDVLGAQHLVEEPADLSR